MSKPFHRIHLLLAAALIFSLPNQVGRAQTGTPGDFSTYLPLVTSPGGNNPPPGAVPAVDVKVDGSDSPVTLTDQDSFTVSWTSANATACTGSGALAGRSGTSGSFTDGPKADGTYSYTMTCSNGQGQVSDQVTVVVIESLPIETQTIAAGAQHTCALTQAGGVLCWGGNVNGQLGIDSLGESSTPVAVDELSSGVSAIAAGSYHTCALTQTGGVWCWGNNYNGQLGNGIDLEYPGEDNNPTPVEVIDLSSGVSAIAAGQAHTCALTQMGEVLCWGNKLWDGAYTDLAIPVGVVGLSSGVRAIAAGDNHLCALTQTGGVLCLGVNYFGQLGDGTFTDSPTPVAVVGLSSGVRAIAAGGDHTCALTQDGEVLCWGDNFYGQLGDGTFTNRSTPVVVSGLSSGVSAVAAGGSHTCALLQDGGMQCWGHNWYGQLGNGIELVWPPDDEDISPTPVAVVGLSSGVNAVAAGAHHTCVLTQAGAGQCWGNNGSVQLGDGTTDTDRSTPVDVDGLPPG